MTGAVLIFVVIAWILPIFVGSAIGKPKNRPGWAWGLLLGWLGVIIVALLPAQPGAAQRLPGQPGIATSGGTVAPATPTAASVSAGSALYRECPHCKEAMRRDASVCPHCRHESPAWTFHQEWWWAAKDGIWYWLDEKTNVWTKGPGQEDSDGSKATGRELTGGP